MKLYGSDGREVMVISAIEREGDNLLLSGKVFTTMPLSIRLRPQEARNGLKLFTFRTMLFALSLLFRRDKNKF